ncbi:transcription factor WhiB [Murinocardiopsis flavida]|uniref:Transcription factor WhiB n=1 Tax=Murinocardiopsis flavida TaxID=645275 RepID=A0A2P8C666_9ACTN|nr:WhiB family transcriptional regulator [Murinocardiopsis flavida]PSK80458.1 transcription factor WhiB [Murinocardiopsis flavida]
MRTIRILARYATDGPPPRAVTENGLCRRMADPDAWHPVREYRQDPTTTAALETCRACPVAAACLDYALARPWISGIWGATTTRQRRTMRAAAAALRDAA